MKRSKLNASVARCLCNREYSHREEEGARDHRPLS